MIINSFNNFSKHKRVNFGYDKELDMQVTRELAKDKQNPINKNLYDLKKYCNSTEDTIEKLEKEKDNEKQIEILSNTLIHTKSYLATLINEFFPQLAYKEKEAQHYDIAAGEKYLTGDKNNWRGEMADELSAAPLSDEELVHLQEAEKRVKAQTEEKSPLQEINETLKDMLIAFTQKPQEEKPKQDVIKEFIPNEESPKGFISVGGMDALKNTLKDRIIEPIMNPQQAILDKQEYGKKYPRGVLLYGPPGCGKTFITQAISMEANVPLFELKISKAGSEYINKTSKNYEKAFEIAEAKAKEINKPVIMFIDEIDGMSQTSDSKASTEDLKQRGTLLNLIETARSRNIIVLAATNKYDIMDDAIKRRFDEQIYVGLPDQPARIAVLTKTLSTRDKAHNLLQDKVSIEKIAKALEGFSNDDICVLTDKASLIARNDNRRSLRADDFYKVIDENQQRKFDARKYESTKSRPQIGFNVNRKVSN